MNWYVFIYYNQDCSIYVSYSYEVDGFLEFRNVKYFIVANLHFSSRQQASWTYAAKGQRTFCEFFQRLVWWCHT